MGWWVLVDYWASDDRIPRAIGPYPSEEFCRLAAKMLMPSERRFWTAEERAEAERHDAERQAARELEIAELRAAKHDWPGWITLRDGSSIQFDADGQRIGSSYPAHFVSSCPPIPLTGCVEIHDPPTVASHEAS